MATRSHIGILGTKDSVISIYCHWDGYLASVGKTLLNHYNTIDKINQLMEQGDLSSLGNDIVHCEFYHRDRNEPREDTSSREFASVEEYLQQCHEDYTYLFRDGTWYYQTWKSDLKPVDVGINLTKKD